MNMDLPVELELYDDRTGLLFSISNVEVEFEAYPAEPDVGLLAPCIDYISIVSCTLDLIGIWGHHTFKVAETKTKTLEKLTKRFKSNLEDEIMEGLLDD